MNTFMKTFIRLLLVSLLFSQPLFAQYASIKPMSLHLASSTATYTKVKNACNQKAAIHLSELQAFYFPAPVFEQMMRPEKKRASGDQISTHHSNQVIAYNNLTYSATLADGSPLPKWIEFLAIDHTFIGMPVRGDGGSYKIIFTASDGVQKQSTEFKIHVHEFNEPELTSR